MFEGPRPTVNPVNTQFSLMIAQFLAKNFNPFEFPAIYSLKIYLPKKFGTRKKIRIFFSRNRKSTHGPNFGSGTKTELNRPKMDGF